ncbi:MAG: putative sulfate exporter family transporter, partial [Acidimicrobiales bacterium]
MQSVASLRELSLSVSAWHLGIWLRVKNGLRRASRRALRVGVVLLGFRLSVGELRQSMGLIDVLAVISLVLLTFWGVSKIARLIGLSSDFGRLLGVGYAVCGVSAIAAVKPLTKADDEEVAYAVGLVTLFGTLSMVLYPVVAALLDVTP